MAFSIAALFSRLCQAPPPPPTRANSFVNNFPVQSTVQADSPQNAQAIEGRVKDAFLSFQAGDDVRGMRVFGDLTQTASQDLVNRVYGKMWEIIGSPKREDYSNVPNMDRIGSVVFFNQSAQFTATPRQKSEALKCLLSAETLEALKPQEPPKDKPRSTWDALQRTRDLFAQGKENDAIALFQGQPVEIADKVYQKIWELHGSPTSANRPDIAHLEFGKVVFLNQHHKKVQSTPGQKALAVKLVTEDLEKTMFSDVKKSAAIDLEFDELEQQLLVAEKETPRTCKIYHQVENFAQSRTICYDKSLVPLKDGTFINANFLFGKKYILTQTPFEHTIPKLLQMVDEYDIQTIVALNGLGVSDSPNYLPNAVNQRINIKDSDKRLMTTEHQEIRPQGASAIIACRKLGLTTPKKAWQAITHVHYQNWNDDSSPDFKGLMVTMNKANEANQGKKSPILVHCRGGVSRSMAYIVIDHLAPLAKARKSYSIKDAVKDARDPAIGRCAWSVRHRVLYHFLYNALEKIGKDAEAQQPPYGTKEYYEKNERK